MGSHWYPTYLESWVFQCWPSMWCGLEYLGLGPGHSHRHHHFGNTHCPVVRTQWHSHGQTPERLGAHAHYHAAVCGGLRFDLVVWPIWIGQSSFGMGFRHPCDTLVLRCLWCLVGANVRLHTDRIHDHAWCCSRCQSFFRRGLANIACHAHANFLAHHPAAA